MSCTARRRKQVARRPSASCVPVAGVWIHCDGKEVADPSYGLYTFSYSSGTGTGVTQGEVVPGLCAGNDAGSGLLQPVNFIQRHPRHPRPQQCKLPVPLRGRLQNRQLNSTRTVPQPESPAHELRVLGTAPKGWISYLPDGDGDVDDGPRCAEAAQPAQTELPEGIAMNCYSFRQRLSCEMSSMGLLSRTGEGNRLRRSDSVVGNC